VKLMIKVVLMLIYIRINEALKQKIDALVEKGQYSDFNSAAATALENLVTAEREAADAVPLRFAAPPSNTVLLPSAPTTAQHAQKPPPTVTLAPRSGSEIPKKLVVPLPADLFHRGDAVPVERWIFGQQNRALPAKVNARLFANLVATKGEPVELAEAAHYISRGAGDVFGLLSEYDLKQGHKKDDLLSTGFPEPRSDKSLSRYANHFVAYENTQGKLTGMMIEWKLVGIKRIKNKTYLLPTRQCIELASFHNPLLDSEGLNDAAAKFSEEELTWLLTHLAANVPVEASAFTTLLSGIQSGARTPESLDEYVRTNANEKRDMTNEFISTQRSGALSRMADLNLLVRVRDGIRINYNVTERGAAWLNNQRKETNHE
jgi:hypothetical protein